MVPTTAVPSELPSSWLTSLSAVPMEVWSSGMASISATAHTVMMMRRPMAIRPMPAASTQ